MDVYCHFWPAFKNKQIKMENRRFLMKKNTRIVATVLALMMLLLSMSTAMVGCNKDTTVEQETTATTTDNNGSDNTNPPASSDKKTEYTVSIKRSGGRPMPNLTFYVFEGDDLVTYGQTDANGIGKVSLKPSNNYTVEIPATSLNGYTVEERYAFVGTSASIVLQTSVIDDTELTGVRYQLGDIMRDFKFTTTDGEVFQLSEVLKEKKAVLINFWYSTCGPCVNEFPYLQSAYEKYKDDIEVIALNNYPIDSEETIKKFKETMGLTFPVAKDYTKLGSAFSLQGYPTSIMIDRYGSICLIEVGGLTSEKPFVNAFEYFAADDYEQKLFESIDDIPVVQPSVGTAVGSTCPTISLDVIGSDTKFDIQKETSEGRVVVLNFWFTTCGPCLEELSSFYQVASDYSDKVSVAAVHIELPNVNVTDFIANDSGHPEWNDGTMSIAWDTGSYCTKLFKIQACPVTVVINADGVITDKFIGSLTHDELIAAVEKALGE